MAIIPIPPLSKFSKRADEWDDGDNWPGSNWYWSDEARNIKYGVLFGILILAFLVIMGMWLHADRRMKAGNAPLPYHRWLVARHRRAQWEPQLQQPEQQFSFYQHQQHQRQQETDYSMHTVPPPAYNPNYAQPPVYTGGPPIGSSKVHPSQHPANQMQSQNPYYNSSAGEGSSSGGPTYPPPVGAPVYHGQHTQ
ncbi:uncharacterized protein H6S33_001244 [Morchella sextelata]|uniref:uncharacterized protein n=1 Tax=Morchella sextelata TaxID=1174677 RepID=UPI001D04BFC3|nr:uncharacterized protein H6S33_001244 [Morchella sextelata]KAH0609016.1 hypothetical protein H6S33_001244 [Morchella sextelata]